MIRQGLFGGMLICILLVSSPGNAANFVLEIYGNANMDEFLNDEDIQYLDGIIAGTNNATKLADANFDGKIDEADIKQVQAILDGNEKKLTYIDMLGENETVNKPIRRLVNMGYSGVEMTRILGAEDILVAYGANRTTHKKFFPLFATLPFVAGDEGATAENTDYEKIISLKPDALQTNIEAGFASPSGLAQKAIIKKNLQGIPIISLNMREQDTLVKNVRTYGYILDRENEAEDFINWYSKYYDLFTSRTKDLSDDEKPTAFFESASKPYYCYASGSRLGQVLVMAGGKNILDKKVGIDDPKYNGMVDMDKEFIVQENPKYIFDGVSSWKSGYDIDDHKDMADAPAQVKNRTELANVDAVKNDQVYALSFWVLGGAGNNIIGTAYLAKLFHPDLFKDVDPQAIHQEYVDKFCHIDFNIRENGTFVYPSYDQWIKKN
ncbi:MAG: Periplasmic binding protein [Methanosaeta sp. PtaU1.Bin060]|nr:MAG: Periplasmic binding protein [Methanosaeta sp. PtaU1.Bin060]